MVVDACTPSIWEAEAGGLQVQVQSELRSETLSPNNKCVCVQTHANEITSYTNQCSHAVPSITTRWGLYSLVVHTLDSLVFPWHQVAAAVHRHNLFLIRALSIIGAGKMAQRLKARVGKPDLVSSIPGLTRWKERE